MGIYCHFTQPQYCSGPPHRRPSGEEVCPVLASGNDGSEQDVLDDGKYNSVECIAQTES